MTSTNYTIICEQGATLDYVVTWKDNESNPINNTGYSAIMQVRKESNIAPIIILSTANNRIELGGTNGEIELKVFATDTTALEPADYYYDLDMTDDNGNVSRIIEGIFSIKRQITQ